MDTTSNVPDDPQQPWLCDYHVFIDVHEQVLEGWTAIQWRGVSNLIEYLHTQSN